MFTALSTICAQPITGLSPTYPSLDDRTGPSQRFARTSRWFQCHPAAWALSQGHKAISSGLGSARVPWVVNSWIFEKWEKTCEKIKLIGVLLEIYWTFLWTVHPFCTLLASEKGDTTMPAMKHKTLWIHIGWLPHLTLKVTFWYVSQDMRRGMEHLDVLLWLSRPLAASLWLPSDQS